MNLISSSMGLFLARAFGVCVALLIFRMVKERTSSIPTVRISPLIPDFVTRILFFVNGAQMIQKGYKEFKDMPFRILKVDADVVVLPHKYLDEIRGMPHTVLSLLDAQFNNVMGQYTNVLNDSNLPAHTVAKRLTPALSRIIPKVIDELDHAWAIEIPECENWTSINLYDTILRLINRSTSRVIVGENLCRNEVWLDTVTTYTHNLGLTLVFLRPFPPFMRPIVAKILPSVRALDRQLRWVKNEVFVPMILHRRERELNDPTYEKPDDFMQWMLDSADNDFDREPENIAQGLMIIMALAVIHTSTMLITHALYDLMIRPEYFSPLRTEIRQTLLEGGWANATMASFSAQKHLDSFLRESQRLNPTGEISVQRIAKKKITFSDGFSIEAGTHICFPSGPMARDESIIPNPDVFEGFRWSRNFGRPASNLVSVSKQNLHFGFGRQACPGRFLGANTSKAILSRLLIEYDLKFEEGKEGKRPKNITNGEQIMPNFWTKVLIKRRDESI